MVTTLYSSSISIATTTLSYRQTGISLQHQGKQAQSAPVPGSELKVTQVDRSDGKEARLEKATINYLQALDIADKLTQFRRNGLYSLYQQNDIRRGSGNDYINTYGRSEISSGAGNDIINSSGKSLIHAGKGDDLINASGRSIIHAGDGNDVINAYGLSRINAGKGDDVIYAGGYRSVIDFQKGSGSDTIYANTDVHINLGEGFSQDNVNITYVGGKAKVSFKGSDDELSLYISAGRKVRLNFTDGRSLDLEPSVNFRV